MIIGEAKTGLVLVNGKDLKATAIIISHGGTNQYSWGAEPRDEIKLSLAILHEIVDSEPALRHYNDFRFRFVSPLPPDKDFTLQTELIRVWLKLQEPNIVFAPEAKYCPRCHRLMMYQSARWQYDAPGWRCWACGEYVWDNGHSETKKIAS